MSDKIKPSEEMYSITELVEAGATVTGKNNKTKGRKALSSDDFRRKIGIRLSSREYTLIKRKSKNIGMGASTYIRMSALNQHVDRIDVPEINKSAWKKLAPMGTNLNNIAHGISAGKITNLTEEQRQKFQQNLKKMYALLRQLRTELIRE